MTADVLLADVVRDRDLNATEARALINSIRVDVADIGERIALAYKGRSWLALGYPSWDSLCDTEFPGARLRIPREDRAEQVQSLRSAGLSTRAIGSALGVDQKTVVRDLARGEALASPAPVVGQDGKQYAPTQPSRPQTSAPTAPTPAGAEQTSPPASGSADLTGERPAPDVATGAGSPVVDRCTGEINPGAVPIDEHSDYRHEPLVNPVAAARAEVAKQPAMLAGKAFDRLHTARLLLTEAGSAADIVADLVHDGLVDGDQGDDWLPELDQLLPLLTDLAAALRRRNLRSVSR